MTALTRDITALLTAALANPQCDTTRGALMDAMQERDCWTRETILPWVIQYRSNDAPRLLYALWCEANGEPERGEFIRVQVELARPKTCGHPNVNSPDDCDCCLTRAVLRCRERELLDSNDNAWNWVAVRQSRCLNLSVSDRSIAPGWLGTKYTRGFISHITCAAAADFLKHADAITREHPIEKVRPTTRPDWKMTAVLIEEREGTFPDVREFVLRANIRWGNRRETLNYIQPISRELTPGEIVEVRQYAEQHFREYIASGQWMGEQGGWWPGIAFELPSPPSIVSQNIVAMWNRLRHLPTRINPTS